MVSFIHGGNGVPEEKYRPVASHEPTLSHNVLGSTHRHQRGLNSLECCKSNITPVLSEEMFSLKI